MFEKEAEEYVENFYCTNSVKGVLANTWQNGAEFGYNKANEWHYVKDEKLPRQDGHTCFSIEVLADNKKWVYYRFNDGKWYCGNKEVKVNAWKEIVLPELKESK